MALPYRVESLDAVPEAARELYEETEDGFVLPVDGVETPDEVAGLRSALKKLKSERNELREKAGRFDDEDVEELKRLRAEARKRAEERDKEEGNFDALRERLNAEWQAKLDKAYEELEAYKERSQKRDRKVRKREILAAIGNTGVRPEYLEAVEALMERKGPEVRWDGDEMEVVVPDELHGDKPLNEFMKEWAASEAAEPYMPPKQAAGGGASGRDGKAPASDKPYNEMTYDEKVAFLETKYGSESAA